MSAILDLRDFYKLTDFIYQKVGIRFEPGKQYFVSKRLERRMEETGMRSPQEYIRYLMYTDNTGEFQEFVNLLTVNETYFFREFLQLEAFAEHCLPAIVENKQKQGSKTLRIWSAGCSTGEEPYTLSIILHEMFNNVQDWKMEIVASDIDQNVLKSAKEGRYETRSVKDVPAEYFGRYFISGNDGTWRVTDEVKSLVKFEHVNLADTALMNRKRNFDCIFCRNVLIYFDDVSRKRVVDHFYLALNPKAYIFLGTSESIGRITTAFTLRRMGTHLVYCKD